MKRQGQYASGSKGAAGRPERGGRPPYADHPRDTRYGRPVEPGSRRDDSGGGFDGGRAPDYGQNERGGPRGHLGEPHHGGAGGYRGRDAGRPRAFDRSFGHNNGQTFRREGGPQGGYGRPTRPAAAGGGFDSFVPPATGTALPTAQPVVPGDKLRTGIVAANRAMADVMEQFGTSIVGDYDIDQLEVTVSFAADGRFMGFGTGGALTMKLALTPLQAEDVFEDDHGHDHGGRARSQSKRAKAQPELVDDAGEVEDMAEDDGDDGDDDALEDQMPERVARGGAAETAPAVNGGPDSRKRDRAEVAAGKRKKRAGVTAAATAPADARQDRLLDPNDADLQGAAQAARAPVVPSLATASESLEASVDTTLLGPSDTQQQSRAKAAPSPSGATRRKKRSRASDEALPDGAGA